ncbi:MAG: lipocalin family protein [Alphaproteobacteria bacterium]|nr:lipocalin family protein [Alphaproteobacteria bacterium]
MRLMFLAAAMFVAACSPNPVYRQSTDPLPVAYIDQARYLGTWYEQARLPNSFEEGCQRATAEYGVRDDGLISVVNTCIDERGESRVARGRARPAGEAGEGKLEVSFFGPFWAKYWVLDRGENYEWSIVGEPEGRYLWVLTREREITPAMRAAFERRITELGYRPAEMVWAG